MNKPIVYETTGFSQRMTFLNVSALK